MEFLIGLIIFAIDVYAIAKVFNSSAETGTKVLWILIILLLPVIGVVAWYFAGPK
jgi:hypothetical protein